MLIYVAHEYLDDMQNIVKAKEVTEQLQEKDLENLYICPLVAFPILRNKSICLEDKTALKLDLVCGSHKMIVASNYGSKELKAEIELAKKLMNADGKPMEGVYLEY